MPSKRLTFFMILLLAGGIYAAVQVDRTRDVPRYPAEFARSAGPSHAMPPGERPTPNVGPAGEGPVSPTPPPDEGDESSAGEIRVTSIELQGVESDATSALDDPGDNTLVIIRVDKEGGIHWGGLDTGGFDTLDLLLGKNAKTEGFRILLAPDKSTPWQNVYWVLEAIRDAGIRNVALGCFPTTDRAGTLLATVRAGIMAGPPDPALADGVDEIEVKALMDEEGDVTYEVMGEPAGGPPEVYQQSGSINSEFATMYGVNYAKDPATTPWVIRADAAVPAGKVIRALGALRLTSVYSVRFEGDYGPPPGRKR